MKPEMKEGLDGTLAKGPALGNGASAGKVRFRIIRIALYAFVTALCLLWLLPIWPSLLVSLKNTAEYTSQAFWQFPAASHFLENIRYAWTEAGLGVYFLNSLFYGAAGAFGAVILASLAGFSITRLRPRGHNLLFAVIFSGTVFPFQMYLVPLFKFYQTFGIYDTGLGMILFYIAICTPFALFVFRAFFSTIPQELQEAPKLDGCTNFMIYRKIFLPLSIPAIAVVLLFQFTWVWNDLLFGLILTSSPSARPIMVGLSQLQGFRAGVGANIPGLMGGAIIASVPTIALFVILRRYFIQGLSLQTAGE